MKPKTTKTNKPKAKKSSGPDLKQLLGALGQDDEWSRVWDARKAALEQLLGPSSDKVLHSLIPFEMGGFADVLVFPKFPDGVAYVTAELTCKESAQQPNQLGQYELMFCAKTAESELGGLVSRLATLTRKRKFEIGDILPSTQPKALFHSLLFCEGVPAPRFEALGKSWGLVLCLGLSAEEAALAAKSGWQKVVARRKKDGTFPFSTPQRSPFHEKPFWAQMPAQAPIKQLTGAPAKFAESLNQALGALRTKLDGHDQQWGLSKFTQWEMSQESGELVFTLLDGSKARCAAQLIGSFCAADSSWEWAWNNPHVAKPLAKLATQLKEYGKASGVDLLTRGKIQASLDAGWTFAALAVQQGLASGVYCGKAGPIDIFITFGEPTIERPA